MNAPMYTMPWALPGPIGAFLTTGLDLRSLVLMAVLLVVDFVIYYPFCKAYDHQLCLEESAKEAAGTSDADAIAAQENAAKALEAVKSKAEQIRVLCFARVPALQLSWQMLFAKVPLLRVLIWFLSPARTEATMRQWISTT